MSNSIKTGATVSSTDMEEEIKKHYNGFNLLDALCPILDNAKQLYGTIFFLGIGFLAFCHKTLTYMIFYPLFRLVFGTLYPAYASYKAVKSKNVKEYVKWMMYWIVFALFTCVETITDVFLSWFPFYYEIKIILVIWLLSPATKGSSFLYRKFVHPMLSSREQEIDEYISKAKEQSYKQVLDLGSKGVNVLMQTALKGGGGLVNHIKKSYSLSDLSDRHTREEGTDETDVMISDPRLLRKRQSPRRTPSTSMYFSEIDVRTDAIVSVQSAEDLSSGYSSGDAFVNQPLKLQAREGLVRSGSVSNKTRPTRVTRSTMAAIVPKKSSTTDVITVHTKSGDEIYLNDILEDINDLNSQQDSDDAFEDSIADDIDALKGKLSLLVSEKTTETVDRVIVDLNTKIEPPTTNISEEREPTDTNMFENNLIVKNINIFKAINTVEHIEQETTLVKGTNDPENEYIEEIRKDDFFNAHDSEENNDCVSKSIESLEELIELSKSTPSFKSGNNESTSQDDLTLSHSESFMSTITKTSSTSSLTESMKSAKNEETTSPNNELKATKSNSSSSCNIFITCNKNYASDNTKNSAIDNSSKSNSSSCSNLFIDADVSNVSSDTEAAQKKSTLYLSDSFKRAGKYHKKIAPEPPTITATLVIKPGIIKPTDKGEVFCHSPKMGRKSYSRSRSRSPSPKSKKKDSPLNKLMMLPKKIGIFRHEITHDLNKRFAWGSSSSLQSERDREKPMSRRDE